jgi:aspartyl-tRNA(Asn)/glutamyl-tRNA(Gln) amidotransferase subunit A
VRAVDYLNAQHVMRRAREEVEAALKAVDAIVIPTAAIPAPPIGSERVRVGDIEMPLRSALVDMNRMGNFTGLPAISMPCGLTQDCLPVALQFVGRRFEDTQVFGVAHRFSENERDWEPRHPPVD